VHVHLGAHPLVHAGQSISRGCTLDVLMPLAVALDGGVTVLPTSTLVDLFPEVRHPIASHRRAMLHWRARTWQPRGHLRHGRRMRH
jgi:hypothetical protein